MRDNCNILKDADSQIEEILYIFDSTHKTLNGCKENQYKIDDQLNKLDSIISSIDDFLFYYSSEYFKLGHPLMCRKYYSSLNTMNLITPINTLDIHINIIVETNSSLILYDGDSLSSSNISLNNKVSIRVSIKHINDFTNIKGKFDQYILPKSNYFINSLSLYEIGYDYNIRNLFHEGISTSTKTKKSEFEISKLKKSRRGYNSLYNIKESTVSTADETSTWMFCPRSEINIME